WQMCCSIRELIQLAYMPFFFQAEDGIRDFHVTGVQTCALPISRVGASCTRGTPRLRRPPSSSSPSPGLPSSPPPFGGSGPWLLRSEERRVGKESTTRGTLD